MDGLTRRQLRAIATVSLLAPVLRLLPGRSADYAGSASWLCAAAALPVLLLITAMLTAFLKNRRDNEGLGGMLRRALGPVAGGVVLFIFGLWLTLYAGFILRSGADRFVVTIYPASAPWVFVFIMLFIGTVGALGRRRTLGRSSELFRPLLVVILGLVIISALFDVDMKNLLPVTGKDVVPVLTGAAPIIDVIGFTLVVTAFLEGYTPIEEGRGKSFAIWTALCCLFVFALCLVTVGKFGADLVSKLQQPFFVLARNVKLFGVVERIEAFVTALWVFPDFVLVTLSLSAAAQCFRVSLGYPRMQAKAKPFDMKNGRYLTWACAALALATALTVAPTAVELALISNYIVPAVNIALGFLLLPVCFLIGKARKKI